MNNLVIIGSVFILLLAIFHSLLFSKRIRQSGVFWHVVDYVWLLTAAVALAFLVGEVQRLGISSSLDVRRSRARGDLNGVRMHASHIWQMLQGTWDKDGGHRGIDWFKKVADELEFGIDSLRWEHFVSQNYDDLIRKTEFPEDRSRYIDNPLWAESKLNVTLTDPYLVKEATEIIRNLKTLSDEKYEVYKMETELKSTDTEKAMKIMWPWFLCFALALRITKVTADLTKYVASHRESAALSGEMIDLEEGQVSVESDAP